MLKEKTPEIIKNRTEVKVGRNIDLLPIYFSVTPNLEKE